MKRILNVILYTTIRITGVAGVIWFFVSSAATLELVINGADMTTWEKDPYIECLEWLIASVYLFGIYSLLSLLILRKRKIGRFRFLQLSEPLKNPNLFIWSTVVLSISPEKGSD